TEAEAGPQTETKEAAAAASALNEIEIPTYANITNNTSGEIQSQRNGSEFIPLEGAIKFGIIDLTNDLLDDMTIDFYNYTVDLDIPPYNECLKEEGPAFAANLTIANLTAEDRRLEGMDYCIGIQHLSQEVQKMFGRRL
ncbi:MAG: hypothetical protein ACRD8Z_23930, partial [Nitrososphaeraceae archaeon]